VGQRSKERYTLRRSQLEKNRTTSAKSGVKAHQSFAAICKLIETLHAAELIAASTMAKLIAEKPTLPIPHKQRAALKTPLMPGSSDDANCSEAASLPPPVLHRKEYDGPST